MFSHHFSCPAVSIDRTCTFPVWFFRAEIHIHAFYTLPMAGLGAGMLKRSRMDPSCCLCSPLLSPWPQQIQVSLQHAVHRPSVPAKLLQSGRQKVGLFSFPCTSPVGKRGHAPAPGHSVGLACSWHVREALTSACLPTAEECSGFTGDKQVSHFRPLPSDQDLTQPGSSCQQKPRQSTLCFLFQIIS